MPRSSRVQTEATVAEVLRVATQAYADHGFAGVGLEDVAARAGVTRGAVYHHFGSKQGLFAAVHERVQREVEEAIDAASAGLERWDALVAGSRAFLAAAVDDSRRRILLADGPAVLGWDRWREGDDATAGRQLREGLEALVEAGDLVEVDVEAVAVQLSGAMNEAAWWIAAAPASARPDRLNRSGTTITHLIEGLRR